MCGILICLSENEDDAEQTIKVLKKSLVRRGPDIYQKADKIEEVSFKDGTNDSSKIYITFVGCVLWLRGKCPQSQPLINEQHGSFLLWNGDIFGGVDVLDEECDTSVLSKKLSDPKIHIPEFMSTIQGPFAFAYYHSKDKKLWFGRDFFGRHNLLIHRTNKCLILTSVMENILRDEYNFFELPADGIFQVDLNIGLKTINLFPYTRETTVLSHSKESVGTNIEIDLHSHVGNPLSVKVLNNQIDSDMYKCIEVNNLNQEQILIDLLSNPRFSKIVDTFTDVLLQSVKKRIFNQPKLCKDCVSNLLTESDIFNEYSELPECTHSKICVLFSGGVDCAVLAALANQCAPINEEIDLINVAFEQRLQKIDIQNATDVAKSFDVPDRKTGIIALEELKGACPKRKFNFVMVNVQKHELIKTRNERINSLLFPLETVLDDSIGCAIWFASKADGTIFEDKNGSIKTSRHYQSPSRVILLGMGADEQLGGYSRHRERFRKEGHEGLLDEIRLGNIDSCLILNRLSRLISKVN